MEARIVKFTTEWIPKAKAFSDEAIGLNYYSQEDLVKFTNNNCSFLLVSGDPKAGQVLGLRLTLPKGDWWKKMDAGKVHPELWGFDPSEVGYFKSIFLSDRVKGKAFGQALAQRSMDELRSTGHKAVVCHSWNESPQASSRRYLERIGFKPIKHIEKFWFEIDYECTRCGKPCLCSATEMIRPL